MRANGAGPRGCSLRAAEAADPAPGEGKVLLRLQACGVRRADGQQCRPLASVEALPP